MNVTFVPATDVGDFETPELKKRADQSTKRKTTRRYRVCFEGREVAFLTFNLRPEPGLMVIYEIFVAEAARRQGIGTAVLNEAERICARQGFPILRVRPPHLDQGLIEEALAGWYCDRGYTRDSENPNELYKVMVI